MRKKWRENRKKKESAPVRSQTPAEINTEENVTDTENIQQQQIERKYRSQIWNLQRRITVMADKFKNLRRQFQRLDKKIDTIITKLDYDTKAKDKNETVKVTATDDTPIKTATEFINQTIPNIKTPQKEEVKKKLIEHAVLQKSFKEEYKKSNQTEKDVLKRIVESDILKKYKKTTKFKMSLGLQTSAYKKINEHHKKNRSYRNK